MGQSWSHRLVRGLVPPLIRLGVTPNQITALHLVLGLGIVAALARGTPAANLWAGIAWLVACLLDRLDGELARLGDMCSAAGHRFDCLVDTTLSSLFFLGLGIGLRGAPHGGLALACGSIASASMAALNWVAEQYDSRSGPAGKILASRWGFDADDALYLLAFLPWLPAPLRVATCVLAAIGTGGFLLLFLRRFAGLKRRIADGSVISARE